MLSFFVRLLLFISALWIVRRFLGNLFGESPKQAKPRAEESVNQGQKMVRDPVCGMYMDPRLAVKLDSRKETFYFCSDECRRKYLA